MTYRKAFDLARGRRCIKFGPCVFISAEQVALFARVAGKRGGRGISDRLLSFSA